MPFTEALSETDLRKGTELLLARLNEIIDSEQDVSDIHDAFELYCMRKYSLGNSAGNHQVVGGVGDLGIDFYSQRERTYHVGQCKTPEADYLEANPTKAKVFGPQALNDARDALRYLFGQSELKKPNEQVRRLYALIQPDRNQPDFAMTFYIIVYGRLNPRAKDGMAELKNEYDSSKISIVLIEMDGLVSEFLLGSNQKSERVEFDVRIRKGELLRAHNYCYFLANASDLFRAFTKYGWVLFDLNLRYEVRNSPVNGEIIQSLSHSKSRRNFHHYNNGLIVVADNYSFRENDGCVRLTGVQIVNGLQTMKSIYDAVSDKQINVDDLESDCLVPMKVIKADDVDFISKVVRATNNQNPMAQRNLRSNNPEQKILRADFQALSPRWFYQLKEGEWESLTSERSKFFERVVGLKSHEFQSGPTRKTSRVIDNQEAAKAWLAFIGFADKAGDRVTHYFADNDVYDLAFGSRPSLQYWKMFGEAVDWDASRETLIERIQGSASQYLLAFYIWKFVSYFVPSPQKYRELALDAGVQAGKIRKASGSYTSNEREQDAYLAESDIYQTWRLMANMKELVAEVVSQILTRKYGPLDKATCARLLHSFEASDYRTSGDARDTAQAASQAKDLAKDAVFSRILRMLHFVCQQFWENKKQQLLSTSRLRTYLLKREMGADLKRLVWEFNDRTGLDRVWKPQGATFLDSLPPLP